MHSSIIKYRPDIDGLRAVAVIAVILFHYFPYQFPYGYIGVDVFFVISGYLITGIILKLQAENKFTFANFYAHRIRRIIPALLFVFIFILFVGKFCLSIDDFEYIGKCLIASGTFTTNFLLWKETGYFDIDILFKPFLHIWSIAIEEQFYLIWPPLLELMLWKKWNAKLIISILILLSFGTYLWEMNQHPNAAFYLFPSRFWELALGCLLAMLMANGNTGTVVSWLNKKCEIVLFLLTIFICLNIIYFDSFLLVSAVLSTFLYILLGEKYLVNRILSKSLFVGIGKMSYSLYLWHWPILSLFVLADGSIPSLWGKTGLLFSAFIMAAFSYIFIERKFQNIAIGNRQWLWLRSGILSLICCCLVGYLAENDLLLSTKQKDQFLLKELATYRHYPHRWVNGCFLDDLNQNYDEFESKCIAKKVDNKKSIFIWGDSSSAVVSSSLNNVVKKNNLTFSHLGGSNCAPALNYEVWFGKHCLAINDYIFTKIIQQKPDLVILSSNWTMHMENPHFLTALRDTVIKLQDNGIKHILILGQFPLWKIPLYKALILLKPKQIPKYTLFKLNNKIFKADAIIQQAVAGTQVNYLVLIPEYCNKTGCLTNIGDNISTDLTATDNFHFSDKFADIIIVNQIMPDILKIVEQPK